MTPLNAAAESDTAPGTARLFVALWPPPAVVRGLQSLQQAACGPGPAQPVPSERLHLTLHFLGAVPRERLAELRATLCVPFSAFELRLQRLERWSPGGLVVVQPERVPTALQALHAALAQRLESLGLRTDRRSFRPHVTLARRHTGAWPGEPPSGAPESPGHAPPLRWRVRRYGLAESLPGPQAPYRLLQSCPAQPGPWTERLL